MCPNDKQFKALSPSYPHNSIAASKALNKLTAVGLPTFDDIVFSAIHITKNPLTGTFVLLVRSENWENKNQLTLIFFEPIVEMLASKGSGSNRSERYIFDGIVFSAIHITKNPLTGTFLLLVVRPRRLELP